MDDQFVPTYPTHLPGWPTEPEFVPARRPDAAPPQAPQPTVVNNYYAAPVKRGLQPGTVLAWALAAGMVVAVLVAVSVAAVAIAGAMAALAVVALVLRSVWRDYVRDRSQ